MVYLDFESFRTDIFENKREALCSLVALESKPDDLGLNVDNGARRDDDHAAYFQYNSGLLRVIGFNSDCFMLTSNAAFGVEGNGQAALFPRGVALGFEAWKGAPTTGFYPSDNKGLFAGVAKAKDSAYFLTLLDFPKVKRRCFKN